MSKAKKILVGGVAVLALSVFAGVGVNQIYAQEESNQYPLIIQNLAEKFGKPEDEIQEVFESTREQRMEDRLDRLVEEGVITAEEKEKVKIKQEEVRLELESVRESDMSVEERHDAMQAIREEVQEWAESEGIDLGAVMGGLKGGGRMRGGAQGKGGLNRDSADCDGSMRGYGTGQAMMNAAEVE